MLPYSRQDVTQDDVDAVIEVLKSSFLTQGPLVPAFESALADTCRAQHAVLTSSATTALHLACLSLGIGPGDIVWTSPITFVATANCVLHCGGEIDFVDIDPLTFNISPLLLEDKLVVAEKSGTLPKAVIAVHMAGQSCDMVSLRKLADRYDFKIIEDASHAIGGRYLGQPIGSCAYSDIVVFSFHPVKIITTGEGGAALTNSFELARKMRLLRAHGITRDVSEMKNVPDGDWAYEQTDLGFNYRMTDVQAALGLSQLSRLDTYIKRRNALASAYDKKLTSLPLKTPYVNSDCESAFHLYILQLDRLHSDAGRRSVFDFMRASGIGVNVHYIPVHTQPFYEGLGFRRGNFPNAEAYYSCALTLPLFPGLTEAAQDHVVNVLRESLK